MTTFTGRKLELSAPIKEWRRKQRRAERKRKRRRKNKKKKKKKKNKAGYTAQDAPSMRTFHLRK